jgi:hypothetical protein
MLVHQFRKHFFGWWDACRTAEILRLIDDSSREHSGTSSDRELLTLRNKTAAGRLSANMQMEMEIARTAIDVVSRRSNKTALTSENSW